MSSEMKEARGLWPALASFHPGLENLERGECCGSIRQDAPCWISGGALDPSSGWKSWRFILNSREDEVMKCPVFWNHKEKVDCSTRSYWAVGPTLESDE